MVNFNKLVLPFTLLATLAASAPTPEPSVTPTGKEYYLKTAVIDGGDSSKDGLYLHTYHTGAGLNDVVLSSSSDGSPKGFLNGTYQEFDLGGDFPWGLDVSGSSNYANWEFAYINGGQGTEGFVLESDGLKWNTTEFDSWLVCDWWHDSPQLFYKVSASGGSTADSVPSTCAKVNLLPEYLS